MSRPLLQGASTFLSKSARSSIDRRRRADRLAEISVIGISMIAIGIIFLIFGYVAREALPLLLSEMEGISVRSMLSPPYTWQPVGATPKFNILSLILGTFKVTIVALALATPIALLAAIYTAEFASPRLRNLLKPAIELLAGIPSVVLGFFVLMVLASWLQSAFGLEYRLNSITAGIGLALAIVPVIYTVSEDALTAVPRTYREASLALGASSAQTALRVVLPAASPGIGAAMILGFGRAIGETMIVLMVSGNAAILSLDPGLPVRTLTATIASELGEVVFGSGHYRALFLMGALLFIVTSVLNWLGDRFNRQLRTRLLGTS